MTEAIKYRLSDTQDLNRIKDLLDRAELPIADIDSNKIAFIIATDEKNELIGCVGLEQYGDDGLLRSLAVDPGYRGKGIGHELLDRLLSISRQTGITNLHLLTTTAEKFFSRSGFLNVPRAEAPASINATDEFSSLCPSSSTYMVMKDIHKNECCIHEDTLFFRDHKESGSAYWAVKGKNLQLSYFEVPPNTEFSTHQHESEQITYVLEGELCFEIENKTYRLTNGDTIIIPSERLHRVWTNNQSAKAIDAWSPVNKKYNSIDSLEKDHHTLKQKV